MLNRARFLVLLILCCAVTTSVQAATIFQTDDFEYETLSGWHTGQTLSANLAPMIVDTSGPDGDGDAFLLLRSKGGNGAGSRLAIKNGSDDRVGDYTSTGITSIELDMMNPVESKELRMRLVLFDIEGDQWTSVVSKDVPNDGLWRRYSFPITSEDMTKVSDCCGQTFESLLTNVDHLMFRHNSGEPSSQGTPIQASLGIDNIAFVPEPSSMFLAAFGLLGFARSFFRDSL